MEPNKEESVFLVYAWEEDLCFQRAHDIEQKTYPFSEEGLEQAVDWLEEKYAAL